VGNGSIFDNDGDTMKIKLYQVFAFIVIVSSIVALGRLALGQDYNDVIPLNLTITGICLVMMVLLFYRSALLKKKEKKS